MMQVGVCRRLLVELLQHKSDMVLVPVLRTFGNIAEQNPSYCDHLLDNGLLQPLLLQLREGSNLSMLRSATWTLSNLCKYSVALVSGRLLWCLLAA